MDRTLGERVNTNRNRTQITLTLTFTMTCYMMSFNGTDYLGEDCGSQLGEEGGGGASNAICVGCVRVQSVALRENEGKEENE